LLHGIGHANAFIGHQDASLRRGRSLVWSWAVSRQEDPRARCGEPGALETWNGQKSRVQMWIEQISPSPPPLPIVGRRCLRRIFAALYPYAFIIHMGLPSRNSVNVCAASLLLFAKGETRSSTNILTLPLRRWAINEGIPPVLAHSIRAFFR